MAKNSYIGQNAVKIMNVLTPHRAPVKLRGGIRQMSDNPSSVYDPTPPVLFAVQKAWRLGV